MKLSDRVLEGLAAMVVGDHAPFPYRSSSRITKFFERCGFSYAHDGTTRRYWAKRLAELNLGPAQTPDLPSNEMLRVVVELFEGDNFGSEDERQAGLEDLNKLWSRQGLVAYFDPSGRCYVRNDGSGVNPSSLPREPRPLSQMEIDQRQKLADFSTKQARMSLPSVFSSPSSSDLAFTA
jgi:hypothetical protein